jgi:hypothetical protein
VPRHRGLTGAAGEYYVAAELSRRDWLATVTIKNAPRTDVLAQRADGSRIVAIQTKTASRGSHFQINSGNEKPGGAEHEWFVLVGLNKEDARPDFYVLPGHVVPALIWLEHRDWLEDRRYLHAPPQEGFVRKSGWGRTLKRAWIEGYRERWDLLDQSAWDVPFLGEPVFLNLATEIPLPSDYRPLSP